MSYFFFKIGLLLNEDFNLQNLSLSTNIHDVFGAGLSPKIAEYLVPEEKLWADDYTDDDLALERLFEAKPDKMLKWRNGNYPDGFSNTELDVIGFVLQQALTLSGQKPKINRFLASPYKTQYSR